MHRRCRRLGPLARRDRYLQQPVAPQAHPLQVRPLQVRPAPVQSRPRRAAARPPLSPRWSRPDQWTPRHRPHFLGSRAPQPAGRAEPVPRQQRLGMPRFRCLVPRSVDQPPQPRAVRRAAYQPAVPMLCPVTVRQSSALRPEYLRASRQGVRPEPRQDQTPAQPAAQRPVVRRAGYCPRAVRSAMTPPQDHILRSTRHMRCLIVIHATRVLPPSLSLP